jgi:branched-chain amino acid transport system ATP-binding protein
MSLDIDIAGAAYHGAAALAHVRLTILPAQVTAIVGPNGAGKSTTARVVVGQHREATASVSLDGETLAGRPAERLRRGVALVPEGRRVFASLSVEQTVRLAAHQSGKPGNAAWESATELFPPLARLRSRHAGGLSGGEQQMLALARALASQPRYLLVDEPTLGLAPKVVGDLGERIQALAERGMGVLVLQESLLEDFVVPATAYVLSLGTVVASGPVDDPAVRDAVTRVMRGETPAIEGAR